MRAFVRVLIQMQDHFEHGKRPVIAPLLAQPVVEQCRAIPSWLWCRDGSNRAVARAAFADLLPGLVVARQRKGGFDGFVTTLLEHKRAAARGLLFGGILERRFA